MITSSRLGMGTWGMGGKYERDESTIERSLEVLDLGLSLGLTTIDAAEVYGDGLTEEIVGRAIAGHADKDICVITKVWRTHMGYDDVLRAAEASLARLGQSAIDLYLVHWPHESVPIEETMRAMRRLLDEGIVKAVGVSNFDVAGLKQAQEALGDVPLAANEIRYNLLHQEARAEVIPYCKEHGIEVIAYSPLGIGKIAGGGNSALETLARTYGRTENQVALAWLLAQGVVPIPATLDPEHLRENAGARDLTLAPEDIELLCRS